MNSGHGALAFQRSTHPTLRHPLTGDPLESLAVLATGMVLWPQFGAEDDDDADDDSSGDDDNSGGNDSDSGGDDSNDDDDADSGSDGDDDDDDADARVASMEKRMKAADQRASKAEKALKKIEDAKKDDLTKAQEQVTEHETTITEQRSTINQLRLDNAFLISNKHEWHKPEVALKLALDQGYLEDVISDDGEVDTKLLKKGLDKMATEHAYLVKTAGDDTGPSGQSAGGRSGNGKDDKQAAQDRQRRFPMLGRTIN